MNSDKDWSGEIPSWPETEARAADEREARRERVKDWIAGGLIALLVAVLFVAIAALGGQLP